MNPPSSRSKRHSIKEKRQSFKENFKKKMFGSKENKIQTVDYDGTTLNPKSLIKAGKVHHANTSKNLNPSDIQDKSPLALKHHV
jgi:hypothetical protein